MIRAAALAALLLPASALAEPPQLLSESGKQPRVAVGTDGTVAVAWGAPDLSRTMPGGLVMCRISPDGGKTWNPASSIGRVDKLALGMRRGPQVAVAGSSIAVLAISHASGQVMAWRSADRGTTWTGPVAVNDSPGSAKEGLHAVAGSSDGTLLAVWLDHRGSGMEIRSARSADGGASWERNVLAYASPAGHVCECCHPFAVADPAGVFHVLFRNWIAGSRDIWMVSSADGGRTFGAGSKLGTGTWPLDGCPMAGPWAAPGSKGLDTVWRRERVLYASRPGGAETRLAEADQPAIASDRSGAYRLWTSDQAIMLQPPGRSKARTLAPGIYPAAAGAPDGRGPVIAVWQLPGDAGGISSLTLSKRR